MIALGNFSFTLAYVTLEQGVAFVDERYDEQLSNFREPLREGASGDHFQAAQLHYPPLNYFLLSSLCKEPYELSPQDGTITRLLPHQPPLNNSFARAIEAAHGVRSLLSKTK